MVAVCLRNCKYLYTSAMDLDISSKFGLQMNAVASILKLDIDSCPGVVCLIGMTLGMPTQ